MEKLNKKQVRETAAAKSIGAWIVMNGKDQVATVHAHFGNSRVTVDVWSPTKLIFQGSAVGYGYDKFAAALSGAIIGGIKIFDHCETSDETKSALAAQPEDREANNFYWLSQIGLTPANYVNGIPTSCFYISGLDRLVSFGCTVIKVI